ncbi:MAG: 16S rRNA (cytidine(1402)-2'-O)-methyltransferase [Acidobacteriaceae bacterium]
MLDPGLYLVATPIGNLEDITLRALRVLKEVDRIACEDTRQTQKLLNHFAISTPSISFHEHNEQARTVELIALLQQGGRVAVVSDAGTPAFSDPGLELVRAAVAAGVRVIPIPGANAALSALVASGIDTDRFLYVGFLPAKPGARRTELETLAAARPGLTLVIYEAPHRILETLADVAAVWGDSARVVVARELTKLHEELLRGTAKEIRLELAARERVRGEIVLLIEAKPSAQPVNLSGKIAQQLSQLMEAEGLDEKDALKRLARERGVSKSDLYRELQRERSKK